MTKRLIAPIAILLALFLTNPDRGDFGRYMERQMEREANMESDESGFGKWLGNVLTDGLAMILAESAERKDYLLCSTYTIGGSIELGGEESRLQIQDGERQRYLGLLGTFFKL